MCPVGHTECLLPATTGRLRGPALAEIPGFPPWSLPILDLGLVLGLVLVLGLRRELVLWRVLLLRDSLLL